MNTLRLLLLFILSTAFCFFSFAQCDTNTINKWNDSALDLAYENPKEGLKLVTRILAKSKKCGFQIGEIRGLIRRGICYDVMSQSNLSIDAYNEALAYSRKIKYTKGIAAAQNNLGLIYWKLGKIKDALISLQAANSAFDKLQDFYSMGAVANNLGLIEEELNRDKLSLPWYRKSLFYYSKVNESEAKLDVYSNMANAFFSLNQFDSSGYYSNLAVIGFRKNGNTYGLSIALNNLALVNEKTGKEQVANNMLIESAALAKKIGNEFSYISSTYNYTDNLNKSKKYDQAIALLETVYPEAVRLDYKEMIMKISFQMGIAYANLGRKKEANDFFYRYQVARLIYNEEVLNKDVTRLQVLYDIKLEKQRNALYRKKMKAEFAAQSTKRKLENSILVGLIFILLLTALLIVFILRKRTLQKELAAQKTVFDATTEERKRISYDLHDMVGSQLSYVVNNLEIMQFSDQSNERVQKTFHMSQEAMSSLRDTVWTLHSEEITLEVLSERLQNVSQKWLEESAISVNYQFDFKQNTEIDATQTLQVMRIFQEAISNCVKHAKASSVQVALLENDGTIHLSIRDNGIGLDQAEAKPFHYGLQSMKERALKIKGEIIIENAAPSGTIVSLKWKQNTPNA